MGSTLQIQTPAWALPLCQPARYKAAYGGRGSGKSHFFAEEVLESHIADPNRATVCLREVQRSIKMSVKRLLELKIEQLNLGQYFEVQDQVIKSKFGKGLILFQGMQNHTSDSIKSLEGFDCAWFEEAQNASQRSLDLLRPTIRKPGSEMLFSWNPENPYDPVDNLFRGGTPPPDSQIVQVNFNQNPWFPKVLRAEMEYDKSRDYEKYEWIWGGKYRRISNATVFKNWRIEEFETNPEAKFRFGADWGFSIDPTVLVRLYTIGRTIYIDYEAYQVGCEIEDTPDLFMQVPDSEKWPIVADSARPETISHMRNNGFPKIRKAIKGNGSLKDGIEFLKSYDIVVHPRCIHVIDELRSYSYKVDPVTLLVLPELEDKDNHVIDAVRYALESDRRARRAAEQQIGTDFVPMPITNYM
jgi:phage terminase large subunit